MSNTLCKVLENYDFNMVTLTFTHDLDIINVHHQTKFDHLRSNGSRDINFYAVIFGPMNYFLATDGQTEGDA